MLCVSPEATPTARTSWTTLSPYLLPKKRDFLSKYMGVAREVLEALLDRYMNTGIYEIGKTEVLKLSEFKKFGMPSKIASYFGGKAGYLQAVKELENEIYSAG